MKNNNEQLDRIEKKLEWNHDLIFGSMCILGFLIISCMFLIINEEPSNIENIGLWTLMALGIIFGLSSSWGYFRNVNK